MQQEAMRYNLENQLKIKEACLPLENYFNISLFHFRRFYFKGGLISIFNHSKWMKISFENQYWHSTNLYKKLHNLSEKLSFIYLWPKSPINDSVYQGLYENNLWNGITLYKRLPDCIESYAFATSRENTNVASFYLSEMEVLDRFILYFRSKIFPGLLGSAEKNILLPFSFQIPFVTEADENKKQFLKDTFVKNYYMRVGGVDIKLSKRQKECLTLLSIGMKIKEISDVLKLSSRTVESYIEQTRLKTGLTTTSHLLNIHNRNQIVDKSMSPFIFDINNSEDSLR